MCQPIMNKPVDTFLNYEPGGDEQVYLGTAEYYLRKFDEVPTRINDARGFESQFSIDRNGFEFFKHESKISDWKDEEEVRITAYPEAIKLLKSRTNATRVIPIDHRLRLNTFASAVEDAMKAQGPRDYVKVKPPARYVHVDQSYDGAVAWLHDNLPDSDLIEKLSRTRWGIINIWRPLRTVYRDPFAVCDGSTVPEDDLVPMPAMLTNGQPGKKYGGVSKADAFELWVGKRPKKEGQHKWWYLSEMQTDEVVLLKCFDSRVEEGVCRRAPHSSFEDREHSDREEARQSVEMRCLVFWEDQPV